jgi:hypothetical protein
MKGKISNWLQNIYHIGMLVSIIFIMVQTYYARSSMIRTSEWEKAKMTIENIERFKENVKSFPISDLWRLGDDLWADFSTPAGYKLADTLRFTFFPLFDNQTELLNEFIKMLEVMDAFAYPIIMGYASEEGSFQSSVIRQYHSYSNILMSDAYHDFPDLGVHAKLLYRLWRIRYEILYFDNILTYGEESLSDSSLYNHLKERIDHLLCYEETDFSVDSLKAHRKKLDKKLKEMRKEIAVFRKHSLK